jgi:glycosyltransferase involved in cell wall biosynthesis
MACGCPCVVSKLEWIDRMVRPDHDAVVVGVNPAEVAAGIRRVLNEGTLAETLAQNGRRLVEAHHDRDVEMDRLVDLYKQIRNGGRSRRPRRA